MTRASLTVDEFGLLGSVRSSRCRMAPFSSLDRRSRAALHFPTNIWLAKLRARLLLALKDVWVAFAVVFCLPSPAHSAHRWTS